MLRRGLRGVKLVISDAHEGLKAAIRRVIGASWQRSHVHWMPDVLGLAEGSAGDHAVLHAHGGAARAARSYARTHHPYLSVRAFRVIVYNILDF
jgi:transposase-like protein